MISEFTKHAFGKLKTCPPSLFRLQLRQQTNKNRPPSFFRLSNRVFGPIRFISNHICRREIYFGRKIIGIIERINFFDQIFKIKFFG
jgi:hypothetical protein